MILCDQALSNSGWKIPRFNRKKPLGGVCSNRLGVVIGYDGELRVVALSFYHAFSLQC